MDEFEEEEELEKEDQPKPGVFIFFSVLGKILKYVGIALVIFVSAFFIWRIFSSQTPKALKTLTVNDNTYEAYEQTGDLYMYVQNQSSVTSKKSNYGYFSITEYVIIPEANQIQVTLRYNLNTLSCLAKDYNLPERPDRSLDLFDVSIVTTTDLTPENAEDNNDITKLEQARYFPSDCLKAEKNIYTYRKFVFDGVSVEDLTVGVFFDIYYINDVDYTKGSYGTLCLYDNLSDNVQVKLTQADRKALEGYIK